MSDLTNPRIFNQCSFNFHFRDSHDPPTIALKKGQDCTINACIASIEIRSDCIIRIVDGMLDIFATQPSWGEATIVDVRPLGSTGDCSDGFPVKLVFKGEVGSTQVVTVDSASTNLIVHSESLRMPSGTLISHADGKIILKAEPALGDSIMVLDSYETSRS